MRSSELHVSSNDFLERVFPLCRGRLFHVTCLSNMDRIVREGAIRTNPNGLLASSFGSSKRSFFRLRGCVSVFDYRTAPQEVIEGSLLKCSPFIAGRKCDNRLSFLFLRPEAAARVRSWLDWKQEEAWSHMVVPHVEGGHPGDIPLASIDERLDVIIAYEPGPLARAIEASRLRRRS